MDPDEPPMPPKVTFAQARHMVEALMRGTPDGGTIARELARKSIRQLV